MAELRFRPERPPSTEDRRLLGLAVLLLLLGAVILVRSVWMPPPPVGLLVEVTGEVARPGMYLVDPPTLAAAVEAAGGLSEREPETPLYDGDAVVVEPAGARIVPMGNPALFALPVDVDRHGAEALAAVPGVGASLAEAIVASREADGPFGSVDALSRLDGVGPHRLAKLAPFLVATGTPRPPTPPPAVDLNRATAEELEALPGIGPVLAARIVAARAERPFDDVAALQRVSGVGPSLLAKLGGRVVVAP
jgi:DNA uptake protein ComE-like DNA-binding protein